MVTPVLKYDLETTRKTLINGLRGYKTKIYLFGSQATGKARLRSDIDVAVMPLEPLPSLTLFNIREMLEQSDIVRHVDVIDLSITDLNFCQRVEKEGVLWNE